MKTKFIITLIATILITNSSISQIAVDITTYTPTQLVQTKLLNGCITASSVTFQGDAMQIGYFTATGPGAISLGFPVNSSGIILSSGDTRNVSGPNTSGSTTTSCTSNIHDPQLATLTAPTSVNDCSVLEFDFIPASDTIEFRYIFASEEYPEFVNSTYNDAFGFFLSGPNPSGGNYLNHNIALIPGTTTPVTINNLNNGTNTPTAGPCVNCNYYIDNSTNNWHIEYDGYTTVLTATIIVNMCQTYHIKLAVGDAGDRVYDSSVFLEEGSFSSGTPVSMNSFTSVGNQTNTVYEGCTNYYDFCRVDTNNLAASAAVPISLAITGTAINGVDISTFPTSLSIPAGQACLSVNYNGILDAISDPGEYLVLELLSGCPCTPTLLFDTITVIDIPLIQGGIVQNDTLICGTGGTGGNIIFDAWTNLDSTVANYQWSTGATSQSINIPIPLGNTTYYVTITDPCSQMIIDSINVSFSDLLIDFVGVDISCNGLLDGSIFATPTNGQAPYTYAWNTGASTNSIYNLAAGTYYITVIDGYGCPGDSSFTIIEPAALTTTLTPVNLICFEDNSGEIISNPTGGTAPYTYSWSDGSVTQNAINMPRGTFTVTITDNHNCQTTATATITQPGKMQISGSKLDIDCYSYGDVGSANVQVQAGTPGYIYSWDNGETTPNIDSLAPGIYHVSVTDQNNCAIDTFFIINQRPEITFTNTSTPTYCYGYSDGTATIIPSGGTSPFTYSWSNNTSNQSITNVPSGSYYVTITDANGCRNNFSIFVDQPTEVVASVNTHPTICIGESTILHTSATGGTPPYIHHWDNGSALEDITVSPIITSSYITYSEDVYGCVSDPVSVTVIVNLALEIDISTSDNYACKGDPIILSSIVSGGNGNYTLTLDNGMIISDNYSYFLTNPIKEFIRVTVSDDCGTLPVSDTISVNILPLPEFTLQSDITEGCQPLEINFTQYSGGNEYSFTWDFGDYTNNDNISTKNNPTHTYDEHGTYTITLIAETDDGCRNSLSVNELITVHKKPKAVFSVKPKVLTTVKPIISLNDYSEDAKYYSWNFGDSDTSNLKNPTHTYLGISGDYIINLVVRSPYNCIDSISETIKILDEHAFYYPTAFTPNNDGINDSWQIFGSNIDNDNFELIIYDRWGEIVFTSNNMHESWDGRIKSGEISSTGVFNWVVNYKEKTGLDHKSVGTITLIR